jgi:hypothetical protein
MTAIDAAEADRLAMLEEIQAVLIQRRLAALPPPRAADPDARLARIVSRVLARGGDTSRLHPCDRRRLEADRALAAFWRSVADAGADAVYEERVRVATVRRQARAAADPAERIRALPIEAVRALLPAWRAWGGASQ